MMNSQPNISPERLAQLRAESEQLRPGLAADTPAVREKYRKAAALLSKWSQEDPEYDERVGKLLERELSDSAMRCKTTLCDDNRLQELSK